MHCLRHIPEEPPWKQGCRLVQGCVWWDVKGVLSLAWPACGFSVTPSGERDHLQLLKELKVGW